RVTLAAASAWLLAATHPFAAIPVAVEAAVALYLWRGRGWGRAVPVFVAAGAAVPFALAGLKLASRFGVSASGGGALGGGGGGRGGERGAGGGGAGLRGRARPAAGAVRRAPPRRRRGRRPPLAVPAPCRRQRAPRPAGALAPRARLVQLDGVPRAASPDRG